MKEELENFLEIAGELEVKGMSRQNKKEKDIKKKEDVQIFESDDEIESKDYAVKDMEKMIDYMENEERNIDELGDIKRCSICPYTSAYPQEMKTHLETHVRSLDKEKGVEVSYEESGNTKDDFPCVECGKVYGTKGSLRTHKYTHHRPSTATVNPNISMEKYDHIENELEDTKLNIDKTIGENLDLEDKIDALCEKREGLWHCIECGKTDKVR